MITYFTTNNKQQNFRKKYNHKFYLIKKIITIEK